MKIVSDDKIASSVLHIKNAGIKLSVDNIFGAPSETEDDLRAGLALYQRLKADRILTFWITYYPGTSIIAAARSANCLSAEDVAGIEQGYAGFTHGTGSVSAEKAAMYYKYELLFQLRSLVHNDRLFAVLAKVAASLPFKRLASRLIIVLNALANRDFKFFYLLRYIWAKKNTP